MAATLRFSSVVGMCLLWASPVLAQRDGSERILRAVPAQASAVVVVPNLQQASENLDRVAQTMQLPPPHLLTSIVTEEVQGVQTDGPAGMIWVGQRAGRNTPSLVMVVAVEDYDRLVTSLGGTGRGVVQGTYAGQPTLIAQRQDLAVLASPEDRAALEAVLQADGPPAELSADWRPWLQKQDIGGILLSPGIDFVAQTGGRALANMREGIAQIPEEQRQMIEQSIGMYQVWLDRLGQNASQLAMGMQVDDQALRIHGRMRYQQASQAPSELPRDRMLVDLPDQPFVLAFSGEIPPEWSKALMDFYGQMMRGGMGGMAKLTADQQEQLAAAMRQSMQGVNGMGFLMGVPPAERSIYANTYGVMKVDNAAQFHQRYKESMERMSRITRDANIPFVPDYEITEETIGGQTALKIVMDFNSTIDLPQNDQGAHAAQAAQAVLGAMIGGQGKVAAYVTAVDESTVVMAYDDPANLQRAIESYRSDGPGLQGREMVQTTVGLLPENRQLTVLLSLSGVGKLLERFMQAVGAPANALPAIPESPPVGVAIVGEPQGIAQEVVVPMQTLQAVGQVVQSFKQNFGQSASVEQGDPVRVAPQPVAP